MLSVWFRPHHWSPGLTEPAVPLQVHFDLKERLGLPEAIISENTIVFHEPVRVGDRLRTHQILRSISGPKTTKLGTGPVLGHRGGVLQPTRRAGGGRELHRVRLPATGGERHMSADRPVNADRADVGLTVADVHVGDTVPTLRYPVSATTVVLGALAARDWRPMHHDHDFAVNRNGTQDIFLNTPNQAAWFERYLTDWSGPRGRLGRMTFRMKGSVFPGDTMALDATVTDVRTDEVGCAWVEVAVALTVDGEVKTTCTARLALPATPDDNPWRRRGDQWKP